jgi:hypothetical protein
MIVSDGLILAVEASPLVMIFSATHLDEKFVRPPSIAGRLMGDSEQNSVI